MHHENGMRNTYRLVDDMAARVRTCVSTYVSARSAFPAFIAESRGGFTSGYCERPVALFFVGSWPVLRAGRFGVPGRPVRSAQPVRSRRKGDRMCDPSRQESSPGEGPRKGLQELKAICVIAARVASVLASCATVLAFLMG